MADPHHDRTVGQGPVALKAAVLGFGLLGLFAVGSAIATVCTTYWYERVYLPRIAGED